VDDTSCVFLCSFVGGSVGLSGTNSDYNGMAPEAKLAFFDVGKTGQQFLSIPSLYDYVFPAAYGAGARIHSNSWGSSYQACDDSCFEIDKFTYENKDFAVLFAAGNDGSNGYFSIGNPAMSKNCITVGATQTTGSSGGFSSDDLAFFSSIGPTFDNRWVPANALLLFLSLKLTVAVLYAASSPTWWTLGFTLLLRNLLRMPRAKLVTSCRWQAHRWRRQSPLAMQR
jgi:hypothetical protein